MNEDFSNTLKTALWYKMFYGLCLFLGIIIALLLRNVIADIVIAYTIPHMPLSTLLPLFGSIFLLFTGVAWKLNQFEKSRKKDLILLNNLSAFQELDQIDSNEKGMYWMTFNLSLGMTITFLISMYFDGQPIMLIMFSALFAGTFTMQYLLTVIHLGNGKVAPSLGQYISKLVLPILTILASLLINDQQFNKSFLLTFELISILISIVLSYFLSQIRGRS